MIPVATKTAMIASVREARAGGDADGAGAGGWGGYAQRSSFIDHHRAPPNVSNRLHDQARARY
jgi:hypothetical protein